MRQGRIATDVADQPKGYQNPFSRKALEFRNSGLSLELTFCLTEPCESENS